MWERAQNPPLSFFFYYFIFILGEREGEISTMCEMHLTIVDHCAVVITCDALGTGNIDYIHTWVPNSQTKREAYSGSLVRERRS